MNDFETVKDILEIAEVLTDERENVLEVMTYCNNTGKTSNVIFEFNDAQELTNIYTED